MVGSLLGAFFGQVIGPGTTVWIPVWPDSSTTEQRRAVTRPAPGRGVSGATPYFGVLLWTRPEEIEPAFRFPTLYGLNIHRDFGRLEVIPLSLSAAVLPRYSVSVIVQAGGNYRLTSDLFAGASGGAAFVEDAQNPVPAFTLRAGGGDVRDFPLRVEAHLTTVVDRISRPHLYLVIGNTVR
jgi:hypothetical protein